MQIQRCHTGWIAFEVERSGDMKRIPDILVADKSDAIWAARESDSGLPTTMGVGCHRFAAGHCSVTGDSGVGPILTAIFNVTCPPGFSPGIVTRLWRDQDP